MDKMLVERLANDAGLGFDANGIDIEDNMLCFAALIAEECAKVVEARSDSSPAEKQRRGLGIMSDYEISCAQAGEKPTMHGACAAAIRAKFPFL